MLGVAVSSVSKWIDGGNLVAGRTPGGHRRIEAEDLVRFLRQQKLRIPSELQVSPPNILIVDDEEAVTRWLAMEIGERFPDFEVKQAQDGFAAGEIVGALRPDVIILDLLMPGIDGFEVCRRIKSNPLTSQARVVAITGSHLAETRERILSMGADTCLVKPFDINEIMDEVAKAVHRYNGHA